MTWTITIAELLWTWLGMLAFTLTLLALPPLVRQPRWMQGWLIPHTTRQTRCRVQCVTCRQ